MTWSPAEGFGDDLPILEIPQLAAIEYAAWRTRRDPGGWTYRLPTDLEWEKAARGADRRIFVWGDYLIWSFCWCPRGYHDWPGPNTVGISPVDESVYGVRDMGGSVAEWTTSRPSWRDEYRSHRGGHWFTTDDYFFRVANRNGLLPWNGDRGVGFRLVAELPAAP